MSNVTNELIYEQLKAIRVELADAKEERREIRDELRAVKTHLAALVQSDLNREASLAALTLRVERIEQRLELID